MEGTHCCHPYPLGPPWRFPVAFVDGPLVASYLRLLQVTAGDFSLAWEKPGSKPIRDKSWWINSPVSWASSTQSIAYSGGLIINVPPLSFIPFLISLFYSLIILQGSPPK